MNAAVTDLYWFQSLEDWSQTPCAYQDSLTAEKEDALTRDADLILLELLRNCLLPEGTSPAASAKSASGPDFRTRPECSFILEKAPTRESATAIFQAAVPDAAQNPFQQAESKLSCRTEMTAQYALKLLRRLKMLVDAIGPSSIHGRVLASVDATDGAATLEWIRSRSRLGFVLDPESESSWFIVLPSGASRSGYLYGHDGLKSLRGLLEEFLAAGE